MTSKLRPGAVVLILPLLVSCEAWKLERAGRSKCEQGFDLVLRAQRAVQRGGLLPRDRAEVLRDLRQGSSLLREGMSLLARAEPKDRTSPSDITRYTEALTIASQTIPRFIDDP